MLTTRYKPRHLVTSAVIAGRSALWYFFATTVNYIDRLVLGILAPTLEHSIGWTQAQYGYIVASFQIAYAIGLLITGRVLDIAGTRLGYATAVLVWRLTSISHSFASGALSFGLARFALGLGEAGISPLP